MPVLQTLHKGNVPVKIYTNHIDSRAYDQLENISKLDIIHHHIAAMPDVHLGIGATVGSVIPTLNAMIPAAVGVDIGCGMNAIRLSLKAKDLPDNLKDIRLAIEASIPVGFAMHQKTQVKPAILRNMNQELEVIFDKHPRLLKMMKNPYDKWTCQLGTLGGGNHFIELCLDENQDVWVMLHSGSRGIGNCIGRHFIGLAKKDMEQHISQLPHKDLAYFSEGSAHFNDYVQAVNWAQDYAFRNRQEMMRLTLESLAQHLPAFDISKEAINCHHNYVNKEHHFGKDVFVTRKGAIRAGEGELGIIPGSMGAKSFIVRGKGNPDSFCSCAHGAGRKMSRTEAKRRFEVKTWSVKPKAWNAVKMLVSWMKYPAPTKILIKSWHIKPILLILCIPSNKWCV